MGHFYSNYTLYVPDTIPRSSCSAALTTPRYVFMELATGGDLLSFLKQRTQIED